MKKTNKKLKFTTWYDAEFIVSRDSRDETTLALVYADVNDKRLLNEKSFLKALKQAITEWVKNTPEGKSAWEQSSKDFNVGDLSLEPTHSKSSLWTWLDRAGIQNLRIETISHSNTCEAWSYDTVLADLEDGK